jgi:hypothetical protein
LRGEVFFAAALVFFSFPLGSEVRVKSRISRYRASCRSTALEADAAELDGAFRLVVIVYADLRRGLIVEADLTRAMPFLGAAA